MEKTKDRTPEDNTAYATKQYWDQRYEQCVSFHSIHNLATIIRISDDYREI